MRPGWFTWRHSMISALPAPIITSSLGSSTATLPLFFSATTRTEAESQVSTLVDPREFSTRTSPPGRREKVSDLSELFCAFEIGVAGTHRRAKTTDVTARLTLRW
jgi:hypothetical protein